MKKLQLLALLFVALFSLTLTSCDKDDDEDAAPTEELLTTGVWKGNALKVGEELVTRDKLFRESMGQLDLATWTLRFNADGTGTMSVFGESSSGKWEYADGKKTIVFDKGSTDESSAKVLKLTASELHLEFEDEELEEELGSSKIQIHYIH
ncbi:lipocalin family protein [Pontibacter actiniarum]|uniref:Lipocalin-like domain-containing protein n=1 Tax=Pontibacter actiniarum TaxID=323450 RepID=A0A1X9YR52_9BACT|nr:lipocalin family protein [Pontibacter actiniarum]ARS35321.1 hypothetical protein CA264_07645 [Pontibacter actiniarum]